MEKRKPSQQVKQNEQYGSSNVVERTGIALVRLMSYALDGKESKNLAEVYEGDLLEESFDSKMITWSEVYALAIRNGVQGLVWYAARNCDDLPPKLRTHWEKSVEHIELRVRLFEQERLDIERALTNRGMCYMPLKGSLLESYYPQPGMRTMCDNDVLYGYVEADPNGGYRFYGNTPREREKTIRRATSDICEIMGEFGFEQRYVGRGNADAFEKLPFFNFEMHRMLIPPGYGPLSDYYENPWQRAIPSAENSYAFRLRDEDEYLYIIAHTYKHFSKSGCGVRCLADVAVFLQAKGTMVDWDYVQTEARKAGLLDFEAKMRSLTQHVLLDGDLPTADERETLLFMLGNGTYGTAETRNERLLAEMTADGARGPVSARMRYIARRLWLSKANRQMYFPFFYKYPVFVPVLPIYRICRKLVKEPRTLAAVISADLKTLGKRN